MKSKFRCRLHLIALTFGLVPQAHAASAAWNVDAAGTWVTTTNWTPAAAPGAASGNNSTDVATFGFPLIAARIVTVDATRNIGGITFSNTSAFGYTLSGGGLLLTNNGVIQSTNTTGAHTDTISSPIALQGNGGSATISGLATSSTDVLVLSGAITGVSTGVNVTTLTLNGTNTGSNTLSGIVGDGTGGGKLAIVKAGTGTWQLSNINTFSGGLSVKEGRLLVASNAMGNTGAGTVYLGNTSGSVNATLSFALSIPYLNPITVQAGNTGAMEINNNGYFSPTLAGTITLNKGLSLFNNDGSAPYGNFGVSGKITGGFGLTLTASAATGTVTLSNAANDYTGATAVNSGTLVLTGGLGNTATTIASGAYLSGKGSIGASGSLTLNSGSYLRVDGSTPGALTVGGALTLSGTNTVVLDGFPSTPGLGTSIRLLNYTGTLTGNATNLALQNYASYRGYAFSTDTANQVNLILDTKALTWSGTASAAWDITTSLNWDSGTEKFYPGDGVTFSDSGTTKAVTLGVTVLPASVTFINSAGNDYSLTGTGAIAGTAALTNIGGGTVTLGTPNTYSGGTTISSGKIVASAANALGTGGVTNYASLDLTAGAVTYSGLSTALSGNGTVNVTLPTGSGAVILNGDYSGYTGIWNIGIGAAAVAGKVQMNGLDNASAIINVLTHGTLYVTSAVPKNATLVLNGGDTGESFGQLRIEGATWAGPVILAGDITGTNDGNVGGNSGVGTISGNISETGGSHALVKVGTSSLTLSGNNTYTGATTVNGSGTFKLGSAGALGNGTLHTSGVTIGGSVIFDLAGITPPAAVSLALNSTANGFDVGGFYNTGSTVTISGPVTLGANNNRVGAGTIILNNTLTGNSKNLIRDGVGTLELSNSGTVALAALQANRGGIQVDSGTLLNVTSLSIGTGTSVGSILTMSGGSVTSLGAALFGTGGGSGSGTLQLNSGILTVPSITKGATTFTANFNGGTLKANAASLGFLTASNAKVQANGAIIDDGGFAITIAQPLLQDSTSTGGLTKEGAGTLTLSGASTYTGNTTVNGGILELAATTGSLKLVPTTNGVSNKITGVGAVNLKGVFNIDLTNAVPAPGNSWTLVDVATLAATFDASSFSVTGFTKNANVWTKADGTNAWSFSEATGVLTYTTVNSYANWLTANAPATGFTTDSDNDGIPNGVENVLGTNPNVHSAGLTQVSATASSVIYQHTLNPAIASDVSYSYEWSTDLIEWKASGQPNAGGTTATITPSAPASGVVTVTTAITGGPAGKLFTRIRVVQTP